MEDLLNAKSMTHYIGDEDIIFKEPMIKCYKAKTGDCFRLVYGKRSCLQIMLWKKHRQLGPNTYHVANVYTVEKYRQQGLAKLLFNKAKEILEVDKIYHSSNLSPLGALFAKSVG